MSNSLKLTILCAALTLVAGQALAFPKQPQTAPAAAPPAAAPLPAAAAPAPAPKITKGKVVETMKGGGYTYVCIEKDGEKRWAAMPPTEVKVGDEMELGGGMEMGKFTSKALNRTFEQIYFCGGLVKPKTDPTAAAGNSPAALPHPIAAGQGMPPGHAGVMPGGLPGHAPRPSSATPAAPTAEQAAAKAKASSSQIAGKVVETLDGGGYTYAAVEKDGQRNWVAIPPTKLEVGQEVQFVPGFVMTNFSSKALNRYLRNDHVFRRGGVSGRADGCLPGPVSPSSAGHTTRGGSATAASPFNLQLAPIVLS